MQPSETHIHMSLLMVNPFMKFHHVPVERKFRFRVVLQIGSIRLDFVLLVAGMNLYTKLLSQILNWTKDLSVFLDGLKIWLKMVDSNKINAVLMWIGAFTVAITLKNLFQTGLRAQLSK